MISKTEFLNRVKEEVFPTLDEGKLQQHKVKTVVLVILFVCAFSCLTGYFIKDGMTGERVQILTAFAFFSFLGLSIFYHYFLNKNIEQSKEKLFQMLDLPQVSLREANIEFEWRKKFKKMQLFTNTVISRCDFFKDTTLVFDDINAFVFEGSFRFSAGKATSTIFKGLLVQIETKHFYKEPIVFVKRGFFNGRKGLKKVQLRRQDSYFDVFSNDATTAQNLYFQGVASKLLRVDEKLFKINKIEASFFEDKLYIALYTKKNLFEPIKKHFKDIHQYELFYDEIATIENYCTQFRDL